MHNTTQRFGELRALLQRPSQESWWQACELVDRWPHQAELRQVVLPYCAGVLERWPEELSREAPDGWRNKWLEGRDAPELTMVDRLEMWGEEIGPDELVGQLLDTPLQGLRRLHLNRVDLSQGRLARLLGAGWVSQLRVLSLREAGLEPEEGQLLAARASELWNLQRLELGGNRLGAAARRELARSAHLRRAGHLAADESEGRRMKQRAMARLEEAFAQHLPGRPHLRRTAYWYQDENERIERLLQCWPPRPEDDEKIERAWDALWIRWSDRDEECMLHLVPRVLDLNLRSRSDWPDEMRITQVFEIAARVAPPGTWPALREAALVIWERALRGESQVSWDRLEVLARIPGADEDLYSCWLPPAPTASYRALRELLEVFDPALAGRFRPWAREVGLRAWLEEEALDGATPAARATVLAEVSDALFQMGC